MDCVYIIKPYLATGSKANDSFLYFYSFFWVCWNQTIKKKYFELAGLEPRISQPRVDAANYLTSTFALHLN